MFEFYTIERIEQELKALYEELEKTRDMQERRRIQQSIQERNLQLVRMMPNE